MFSNLKEKLLKGLWYLRIPLIICFVAAIAWGGYTYYQWENSRSQRGELVQLHADYIAGREESTVERLLSEEEDSPLKKLNGDYIGWLTVYGTDIQEPVVLREGDNEYYLDHDFYDLPSSFGCVFADAGTDLTSEGNILIRGHNMKNGTMFGGLTEFEKMSFFSEHDIITLELEDEDQYYEIFALLFVSGYDVSSNYFPIQDYINDISETQTSSLLAELKDRAIYWRDLTMDGTDRFLFLLTSDYTQTEGQLLLCARRLAA